LTHLFNPLYVGVYVGTSDCKSLFSYLQAHFCQLTLFLAAFLVTKNPHRYARNAGMIMGIGQIQALILTQYYLAI